MDEKSLHDQPTAEMRAIITITTLERILRTCKELNCSPGRYIDELVKYDQHLTPRDQLTYQYDEMLRDAANDSDDSH